MPISIEEKRRRDAEHKRKKYQEAVANNRCPDCGKKVDPLEGYARCKKCRAKVRKRAHEKGYKKTAADLEKSRIRHREDRKRYAEWGLCKRCGRPRAEGYTRCPRCLEKGAEGARRRRAENREGYNQKQSEYRRKRREQRIAEHKCTRCGKDLNERKGKMCAECLIKSRRKRERMKSDIDRSERPNYGRCYYCGNPLMPGKSICENCYDREMSLLTVANASEAGIASKQRYQDYTSRMFKRIYA